MKRIGVTGAFGFLGANFIAALIEARRASSSGGEDIGITAFYSRTRENPLFDASEVAAVSLDILDYEDMARKFSGLDAIAHFAGRVDYRPSQMRSVWDANVLGSKLVFDASLAAGVSRLLHVSSICALGEAPAGRLADEASVPYGDPHWPISFASPAEALAAIESSSVGDYGFLAGMRAAYLDAKLAGWELAKAYAREKGLPIVTLFPGTVVGSGDLHFAISTLVNSVWEGKLRLSTAGATAFVAAKDFAAGARLALHKGRLGEGYVIAGRDECNLSYVDFQDMVASLARAEGWRAQRKPPVLPKGFLLGLSSVTERAMPRGSLTRALVLSGGIRNVCSSAKARRELGYDPVTSLKEAILECRNFSEEIRSI